MLQALGLCEMRCHLRRTGWVTMKLLRRHNTNIISCTSVKTKEEEGGEGGGMCVEGFVPWEEQLQ